MCIFAVLNMTQKEKIIYPKTEKLNVRIRVGYKQAFLDMVEQWKIDQYGGNRPYTKKK